MYCLIGTFTVLLSLIIIPCYVSYSLLFSPNKNQKSFITQNKTSLLVLLLSYISLHIYDHETNHGITHLIAGSDPKIQQLLEKTPILRRGPKPPIWFRNPNIQFIPWMIQNEIHARQGIQYQRHELVVTDCIDKSIPNCEADDIMKDTITLDVFPPLEDENDDDHYFSINFPKSTPVVLFAPGLRCHSQDLPSNSIIRAVYGKGFRSIVVNRRGHTPGQKLKSPRVNIFGDVDDLEQVYWHVKNKMISPNTPIFLHGISSGTAVVVSALSKWDKRALLEPHRPSPQFTAAVTATPGYDTSRALQPDRFKWPYNPLMSQMVKDHFFAFNEEILRSYDNDAYQRVMNASSLQDVVDASAHFAGYPNASSYYHHTNPINEMQYISTPVYVINSIDDPCCSIDNLYDTSLNVDHGGKSYVELIKNSERCLLVITRTGSHLPFLDGYVYPFVSDPLSNQHGNEGVMLNSWADQSIAEYYVAALEVYNERRFL